MISGDVTILEISVTKALIISHKKVDEIWKVL